MKNSVVCIVQARINSTRLPSKVLKPLYGNYNALDLIYYRLSSSNRLNRLVFAIPECDRNNALYAFLASRGYPFSLGSPDDLVERYLKVVADYEECIIVRITSDCPLVDPSLVDEAVGAYLDSDLDYVSTYTPASLAKYCNGSDIEVFSKTLLETLHESYDNPYDREHVTFPLWDGRMSDVRHRLLAPRAGQVYSDVRITLDYESDLIVLRTVLRKVKNVHASLDEIVSMYRKLNLSNVNGDIRFDAGWTP